MSFETGTQRFAQVIRWVGGILAVLLGIGGGVLCMTQSTPSPGGALGSLIGGAVVYGIAWALAWVLDGFAKG